MDLAFILTCYRCRSEFLHPDRGPAYCMHCAAPPLGIRGDGQVVQHLARPAPPHYAEPSPRAPPPLVQATHAQRDDDGMLRIYHWRLTSSTTGKQYVTRRRLSAEAARGIDPNAQPVGEPEIISGYGQASTSDFMGGGPEGAPAGALGAQPSAGPLPGWRDGQHHQWSRDPGRGRRYR